MNNRFLLLLCSLMLTVGLTHAQTLPTFSADGAELLPVAQLQLEQLARFLTQHPEAVAEVIVDVVGADARHCYTLSLQRADAVRAFLAAHGVPAVRILLSPYGSARAGLGGTSAVSVRFREGK